MFRPLSSLIFVVVMISCSGEKRVDKSSYEEELNNREIKRISDAELYEAALKVGENLATLSQQKLGSNLQRAVKEQGIEEAIKFCNLNAYSLVDSLEKKYDAKIRRVSMRYRNPSDQPDSLETKLLEAYQYNQYNDLGLQSTVQKLHDPNYFLFAKPILINSPLCLQCHGEVGKELSILTDDLIKQLYPNDLATNYKMNDLRGMWSIQLSKKQIILSEF